MHFTISKIYVLILAVVEFGAIHTQAQIPFLGRCPGKRPIEKFDVSAYLGRWYEIEKFFAVFELGGTCITADYSTQGNNTVKVVNTQIQQKTGEVRRIEGTARQTDPNGSGKLGVRFPTVPFAGEAPYWVLDTDYKSYSIVWSCSDFAIMNFQIVWFLARERTPSEDLRQKVHDSMARIGIRRDLLRSTNQTNCGDP